MKEGVLNQEREDVRIGRMLFLNQERKDVRIIRIKFAGCFAIGLNTRKGRM